MLLASTKTKMGLARAAFGGLMTVRRLFGKGHQTIVRRHGITWALDLREGIDLAIYCLGGFELETVRSCRRLLAPGAVAIDIGANIGAHTLPLAAAVGQSGRVLAYEPTAAAFERLGKNVSLNPRLASRILLQQTMLSNASGRPLPELIYSSWPLQGSAPTHPLHLGVSTSTAGASVSTLDESVERLKLSRVDLIKMDVDGFELEVLGGAMEVLSRFRPAIVVEVAPYLLVERGDDPAKLFHILEDAGYRFSTLSGRPIDHGLSAAMARHPGTSCNVVARPRP